MTGIKKLFWWGMGLLEKHVALRFILAGGTSAAVDLLFLFLLNSVLEVHYLTSAIVAFIIAFGVSFTLHKFWTFRSSVDRAPKQIVMYLGASLFSLALNTFLMYVFVQYVFATLILNEEVNVMVSQVVVGAIVAFVSFFISHRFVFKYKKQAVEIKISQ